MCEYCEEDERGKRKFLINSPVLGIRISKDENINYLQIKSYNHKSEIMDSAITINYCPMCGRKLKES